MLTGTPTENPKYDSVIVRGSGIGALTFAARIARSAAFAGRVIVVSEPPKEDRRLMGGATLRSRALDYLAAAFSHKRSDLLDRLFGDRLAAATTKLQLAALFERDPASDAYSVVRAERWMSSAEHDGRALAFGVRNTHLSFVLWSLARNLPIRFVETNTDSVSDCRDLVHSIENANNPLIVNATPGAFPTTTSTTSASSGPRGPTAWVAATQLTFRARAPRDVVPPRGSLFALTMRERRLGCGIYYPFVDPLTSAADYYGLFFRVLSRAAAERTDRDSLWASLRDEVVGIGRAIRLEPVDEFATRGSAFLPCRPWRHSGGIAAGVLDLEAIYHSGAPIITGDGMTRAALCGLVAAESIIAGEDPVLHTDRALVRFRRANRGLYAGLTWASLPTAFLMGWIPGAIFARGADFPDAWAGLP